MDSITIINGNVQFDCQNVGSPEGFETPTARTVFIDTPERDGSLFINELAGRRVFSWRGLIRDGDIQTQRRLLAAACQPGGLKTIKFQLCDGLALQALATLVLVNPYYENGAPYLVTATAPDPYFESQTLKSTTLSITDNLGGTPIPAAIPAPIGGASLVAYFLTNAGNTYAKPTFRLKGPGTNFTIKNLDTGESILVNLTLAAGETIDIDTKLNTALKGNQSVFGLVTRDPVGQWIRLQPGTNRLVFKAQSGFNGNTQLVVSYRDTYIGT